MAQSPKHRSARPAKPARKENSRAAVSKLDQIEKALRTARGATISDLMELTGWQMHSVRGALAGALKRKRGLAIVSTKPGKERVYRIVAGR